MICKLLCSKSRTLDTFYKISLKEDVEYNERCDDHDTAGVVDRSLVHDLSRTGRIQGLGYSGKLGEHVGRKLLCCKEHIRIERIRPLPAE